MEACARIFDEPENEDIKIICGGDSKILGEIYSFIKSERHDSDVTMGEEQHDSDVTMEEEDQRSR